MNPVYTKQRKLRRYNGTVSILGPMDASNVRRILRMEFPTWTPQDHARQARLFASRGLNLELAWNKRMDRACMATFGRLREFGDYRISGIGREEFSERDKRKLRLLAWGVSQYRTLARAHAQVAHPRSEFRRLKLTTL